MPSGSGFLAVWKNPLSSMAQNKDSAGLPGCSHTASDKPFHLYRCQQIVRAIFLHGWIRGFLCIAIIQCRINENLAFRRKVSCVSCLQADCCCQVASCRISYNRNLVRMNLQNTVIRIQCLCRRITVLKCSRKTIFRCKPIFHRRHNTAGGSAPFVRRHGYRSPRSLLPSHRHGKRAVPPDGCVPLVPSSYLPLSEIQSDWHFIITIIDFGIQSFQENPNLHPAFSDLPVSWMILRLYCHMITACSSARMVFETIIHTLSLEKTTFLCIHSAPASSFIFT